MLYAGMLILQIVARDIRGQLVGGDCAVAGRRAAVAAVGRGYAVCEWSQWQNLITAYFVQ